ncbi:MAG: ATP-binding protein [Patescibacteria group bacterium]|nr:AAA family ATPase [Patescibacteria group bacterium]MDE1965859.1 ATP-binding protein [Patescibacteria group bacterium]
MHRGWFVLTGGPRAGKTSVIDALAARGHTVVPEAARTYLERELAKGRSIEEIRANEAAFQLELLRMKMGAEQALSREALVFFDRGMHDSIPYLSIRGVDAHPLLTEALANARYDAVFLLDRLPYKPDAVRTETPEEAARLHELLGEAYRSAGMKVIAIPVMETPEARADSILRECATISA